MRINHINNNNNIIVNGFTYSPYMVDVVKMTCEKNSLTPAYWIGNQLYGSKIKEYFPSITFQSYSNALQGLFDKFISKQEYAILDLKLIKKMSKYESNALMMMERHKSFSKVTNYQDKLQIYYNYLSYSMGVAKKLRPCYFLSNTTPHNFPAYMLYIACMELGVESIIIDKSVIYGRRQLVFLDDGSPSEILRQYNREKNGGYPNEHTDISGTTKGYLEKLGQDYENYYAHMKSAYQFKEIMPNFRDISSLVRRSGLLWRRFKRKNRHCKLRSFAKNFTYWFYMNRLKSYYDSKVSNVDYNGPYVYVSLHYQPEKSTCPDGDIYATQWLMVHLISRCIPDGWKIYVKEHPHTFEKYNMAISKYRSNPFYDAIITIENVSLVQISIPSFELIDNAMAVATVTGSVGWEAVNRGKPVLTFGRASYHDCEGVFYVPNFEECRAALEKIKAGYSVDKRKVRLYAKVLEDNSVLDFLNEDRLNILGIGKATYSVEENVKAMSNLISSHISLERSNSFKQ